MVTALDFCTPRCELRTRLRAHRPATPRAVSTGAVVGIVFAVIVVVVAIAAAIAWHYHRRAVRRDVRAAVSEYVRFKDGMDGDEMQRAVASGTLTVGVSGASSHHGHGAVAPDAFGVALQEMQGKGDEPLPAA